MRDRVPIWKCNLVESPLVPARSPPLPEFLGTICKGEAHGLEEGLVMPRLTMLENSFLATLSLSGGNLQAFANKGGP